MLSAFRLATVGGLLFLAPLFSWANFDLDEQWKKRSLEIIQQVSELDIPQPKQLNSESLAAIEALAQESRQLRMDELLPVIDKQIQSDFKPKERFLIFITLGELARKDELKALLESMKGVVETQIVLRGLPVGIRRIDEAIMYLGEVDDDIETSATVVLDPNLFRQYNIQDAPTIVYEHDNKPVVWAKGVTDTEWIRQQAEQGKTGDLGLHGTVTEIAERDILEEIAERVAAVDWDEAKSKAKQGFWKSRLTIELPVVVGERAFRFVPEHVVSEDIVTPDGTVLAQKGTRINPIEAVGATFYLVVFDARDPRQVDVAHREGQKAASMRRVKYLVTNLEAGEDGWSEKSRIEKLLNAPIYMADQRHLETFRVERVPSSVYEQDGHIVVHEIPPRPLP